MPGPTIRNRLKNVHPLIKIGAIFTAGFLTSQAIVSIQSATTPKDTNKPLAPLTHSEIYTAFASCPADMDLIAEDEPVGVLRSYPSTAVDYIDLVCRNEDGATTGLLKLETTKSIKGGNGASAQYPETFAVDMYYTYTDAVPRIGPDESTNNGNSPQSLAIEYSGSWLEITGFNIEHL